MARASTTTAPGSTNKSPAISPPSVPCSRASRRVEIPVHYNGEDLDEVAGLLASLREAWAEIRSQVQPAAA